MSFCSMYSPVSHTKSLGESREWNMVFKGNIWYRLKGYVSKTVSRRHTKFSSDCIQLLPNGLQALFWLYILWCGNHGNQRGSRKPLPPYSLDHTVVFTVKGWSKHLTSHIPLFQAHITEQTTLWKIFRQIECNTTMKNFHYPEILHGI